MKVVFGRVNVILTLVAVTIVVLGFLLMGGTGTTEEAFNPEIFSARRIVIAPGLCLLGYLLMIVAIMWRPKNKKTVNSEL